MAAGEVDLLLRHAGLDAGDGGEPGIWVVGSSADHQGGDGECGRRQAHALDGIEAA